MCSPRPFPAAKLRGSAGHPHALGTRMGLRRQTDISERFLCQACKAVCGETDYGAADDWKTTTEVMHFCLLHLSATHIQPTTLCC